MPAGLQIWDETGTLVLDTSTTTLKALIDFGEITADGSATITIPAGTSPVVSIDSVAADYPPAVTVSGSTIFWNKMAGAASMRGRVLVDLV